MKKLLPAAFFAVIAVTGSNAQTYNLLGTGCNEKVYTIAPDPANPNGIYAGGAFTNAGSGQVNYIAKWNGSSWSALSGGVNFYVRSILATSPTEIYVGGAFSLSGSTPIASFGVSKYDGSSWSGFGNGVRGEVYALQFYNSELYAGGVIDTLNGFNPGRGIVKWNGTSWVSVGGFTGAGVGGPPGFKVKALQVFNGELYVGGNFVTAGSNTVNNIAKWDGSSWQPVGTGTNGEVNAFTIHNGELYVGGAFTTAGGVAASGLAKISGTTYTAVAGGVNGTVNGMTSVPPFLYVTGAFTTAGTIAAQNIAKYDGITWDNVSLGINFDGYCLTPHSTDLYVGGFFSVAGTVFANNISRISDPAVGIADAESVTQFSVSPNPSDGQISVATAFGSNEVPFRLSDISGRTVSSGVFRAPHNSHSLDFSKLEKGVYFLSVQDGSTSTTRKIVFQ